MSTSIRVVLALVLGGGLLLALIPSSQAVTKADHSDWPTIDGALILNRTDASRPIDMRPGHDPFAGTDSSYSCDGVHKNNLCFIKIGACEAKGNSCAQPPVSPDTRRHHELLGGARNDTVHAGPAGDVVWGDYNYPSNPTSQRDKLYGGKGADFIYASHGNNEIHTGGGKDAVLARYGRGKIYCDSRNTVVNLSKQSKKRYRLYRCGKVTLKPVGSKQFPG